MVGVWVRRCFVMADERDVRKKTCLAGWGAWPGGKAIRDVLFGEELKPRASGFADVAARFDIVMPVHVMYTGGSKRCLARCVWHETVRAPFGLAAGANTLESL